MLLGGHFVIRLSLLSFPSAKAKECSPISFSLVFVSLSSLFVRTFRFLRQIHLYHSLVTCIKVKNCWVTVNEKWKRIVCVDLDTPSRRSRKLLGRQSLAGSWIATVNWAKQSYVRTVWDCLLPINWCEGKLVQRANGWNGVRDTSLSLSYFSFKFFCIIF